MATRLYPDAGQPLASAPGPPKMEVCGDIAPTLDLASSKSSSIGKKKLPAKRKPACLVHETPMIPGKSPTLRWPGPLETSTLGGPVWGERQKKEAQGKCQVFDKKVLATQSYSRKQHIEAKCNDKHKTTVLTKGRKDGLYTGTLM